MQIIAYTRLHYGADYLGAVIRATAGFAERHVVMYTPVPTFGRQADIPCPDHRDQLHDIAHAAGNGRTHWIEGLPVNGQTALGLYPDADVLLELDADEVIQPRLLHDILQRLAQGDLANPAYRLPFVHHWRSFDHVCRDSGWPVRLYLPKRPGKEIAYWPGGQEAGVIHHFGYARRERDTLYKIGVSMHKEEFRPGWWERVFLAYPERLTDLHPVSIDFWNAEPFDRADIPAVLRDHPYYGLEKIA